MSEFSETLKSEIEEARKASVDYLSAKSSGVGTATKNLGADPDTRYIRRLKRRKTEYLDALVNQFFRFRMIQPDTEGEEVTARFNYLDDLWKKACERFNLKGKQGRTPKKGEKLPEMITPGHGRPFVLVYEAFQQRVEYFMDMEKKQIKAAKKKAEEKIAEHWLKVNYHRLFRKWPFRTIWFWLLALGRKKQYNQKWNRFYKNHIYEE